MSSIKTTITTNDQLPLGERPEGEDQFENALTKLEDAFNRLMSSISLLQKNLDELKRRNEILESKFALMGDPFKDFRDNPRKPKDPLVLTEDMEVEANWKDLVKEENDGH
tara:strand:- start:148 stop:477 length:330 start_codon:yes stop_codon:yes gene_type:complete